ncbi:predicted protein [Nematostella vectensis]|uniref:Alpha-galactosidase n=1 Tax=Nematostella vectensis TaxID=45351 RepID=A7S2L8_NEMVE|nr:predicted protein [Nematostella vectensis]|eukprot:XP_001634089.1 predicted protein [Nematostella vectensis]
MDDGLALTPPMGWMAWERFRCNVDCDNDPDECIHERLFMAMADEMMCDGYLEAGYKYVCIDDCWTSKDRGPNGELQADPNRFPSGIKELAKYVHSKGLKLGIYADYGTMTCERYPGSIDRLEKDMRTFASWDVDYLKMDGCFADPSKMDTGYPLASKYLNATGRPIMFSCSWPFYQVLKGQKPDYKNIAKHCHLWRNYIDIEDSWEWVTKIVDHYAENQEVLIPVAGPGHWNDPDQLIIGNFGLSPEQSKSQMALWAILAAPLFMSNDLRKIPQFAKDVLLNTEVIAVNQDPLGKQGWRVWKGQNGWEKYTEVWARHLVNGNVAVVLFNRRVDKAVQISTWFKDYGMGKQAAVRDLYLHQDLGVFTSGYSAKVYPNGVVMVKITKS